MVFNLCFTFTCMSNEEVLPPPPPSSSSTTTTTSTTASTVPPAHLRINVKHLKQPRSLTAPGGTLIDFVPMGSSSTHIPMPVPQHKGIIVQHLSSLPATDSNNETKISATTSTTSSTTSTVETESVSDRERERGRGQKKEEDANAWGVGRAGMLYRDLASSRLGGAFIASHIRIPDGGPVPDVVHFHSVSFQLIFCQQGWVDVVYEDQGPPIKLTRGDCVIQPPGIRHRVLKASKGLEVVEIGLPAEHLTEVDHEVCRFRSGLSKKCHHSRPSSFLLPHCPFSFHFVGGRCNSQPQHCGRIESGMDNVSCSAKQKMRCGRVPAKKRTLPLQQYARSDRAGKYETQALRQTPKASQALEC